MKKDGWKIVLGTSAREEELKSYVGLLDIERVIKRSSSADEVERSKPHPDIFLAAVKKIPDATPAEAVVIGETPYDAEASRR